MIIIAVVLGSFVGFLSGVIAYLAFGATLLQAVGLYGACGFTALLIGSIAPVWTNSQRRRILPLTTHQNAPRRGTRTAS